jgi:hypothetical protein
VFLIAIGATFFISAGTVTAAVARALALRSPNVAPRRAAKNFANVPGTDLLVTTLMQLYGGLLEQDAGSEPLGGMLTAAVTPLKLFCAYVLAIDDALLGSDGSACTPASAAASAVDNERRDAEEHQEQRDDEHDDLPVLRARAVDEARHSSRSWAVETSVKVRLKAGTPK